MTERGAPAPKRRPFGLARVTAPYPVRPLVAVMGLGAVLPMSAAVFVLTLPNVQDSYHLGLPILVLLAAQQIQLGIGLDLPLAITANRLSRPKVLIGGGAFFALATALLWLAGILPNLVLLYIAIIAVFLGAGALTSTQNALLCDYYPVSLRPRVILAQRAAIVAGLSLCPPLVAVMSLGFGWEAPFLVLAVGAVVFVGVAARLPTPAPVGGAPEDAGEPPTLPEAARSLFTTPSLRLIYYSLPFLLGTVIGLSYYLTAYYENVFHQDAAQRALLFGLAEPGAVLGLLLGCLVVPPRLRTDPGRALRLIAAMALLAGVAAVVLAVAPDVAVAWAAQLVVGAASALVIAGLYAVLSVALPTRMLTLGFGLSTLWLGFGAFFIAPKGGIPTVDGLITDAFGYRASMWIFFPLFAIGASLLRSAARYLAEDIDKRKVSEAADAEVRRARAEGAAPLLMIRSLDAGYDGVQILFSVDLDIDDGEMVAILGTNGAGKSTLMRAISGLVVPSAGEVLFDGTAITTYEPHRIAEAGILQVPGGRGIFPGLTVDECLRVAGWLYDKEPERLAQATEVVLDYFPALARRWHTLSGSLSGGEQQMLSLSMAFIAKPRVLIIDELSLGLAPTVIESLLGIVTGIHEQGTAVLLVEQSVNLALRLCERAIFMEKGRVVFAGPTADLLDRQDIVRAVLLGGSGHQAPAIDRPPTTSTAVLSARGLVQRFGGVVAVDGVDLDLFDGEILGLIGPNGAGKTTIFELLSGERPLQRGEITMGGLDIGGWPAFRRAAHGLGRSFQAARLWPGLTVHESVVVALSEKRRTPGTAAALLNLPAVRRSERRLHLAADEVLEQLGLAEFSDQLTSDLSTGTRRLLELAVIVAMGPRIVLLDEPSAGLAQAETEAMAPVLWETKLRLGCSMMLIEHDMGLLRQLADRVIALDAGAVVAVGDPEDVLNHPRVIESYLGIPAP
jgi:ABC-type branched-subunit amino acid transport system ATPase component/predicted MFS family arabinose efflux permease